MFTLNVNGKAIGSFNNGTELQDLIVNDLRGGEFSRCEAPARAYYLHTAQWDMPDFDDDAEAESYEAQRLATLNVFEMLEYASTAYDTRHVVIR